MWDLILLQTSQCLFAFLPCLGMPRASRGRGHRGGLGRLSMAPLTAGFPASTHSLAILGRVHLAHFEGIFLLLFPSLLLLHLSCLLLLGIPNGSLLPSEFHFLLSSLIIFIFSLPFLSQFEAVSLSLTLIFQMTNLDFGVYKPHCLASTMLSVTHPVCFD